MVSRLAAAFFLTGFLFLIIVGGHCMPINNAHHHILFLTPFIKNNRNSTVTNGMVKPPQYNSKTHEPRLICTGCVKQLFTTG